MSDHMKQALREAGLPEPPEIRVLNQGYTAKELAALETLRRRLAREMLVDTGEDFWARPLPGVGGRSGPSWKPPRNPG